MQIIASAILIYLSVTLISFLGNPATVRILKNSSAKSAGVLND